MTKHECEKTVHLTRDEIEDYVQKIHKSSVVKITKLQNEFRDKKICANDFFSIVLNVVIRNGIDCALNFHNMDGHDIRDTIANIVFGITSGCEVIHPELFNKNKKTH